MSEWKKQYYLTRIWRLRGFLSAISARTISFSLMNADLKTQIYADIFCESLREQFFLSLIYADLKTQIYADCQLITNNWKVESKK